MRLHSLIQLQKCPLLSAERKSHAQADFLRAEHKNAGIKLVAAYMSCPQDTAVDHKGFFTIDAQNLETIKRHTLERAKEITKSLKELVDSFELDLQKYLKQV